MSKFICIVAVAALFSSCASIFNSTTSTFGIDSTPQGAKVEIVNRKGAVVYKGQTPATAQLRNSNGFFQRGIYEITVSMDGYQTKKVVVGASLSGWYFGNILIGGALGMLIVDPATGAMYTFKDAQKIVNVTLPANGTGSTNAGPAATGTASTLKIMQLKDVPVEQRQFLVKLPG